MIYPVISEKNVKLMQTENKLVFIVERKMKKPEIKRDVENLFKVNVVKVNTTILPNGKKKAYVKLAKENPAIDIVTELGLM